MNDKIAKKIGEAHAFAAVCKATKERVPSVFAEIFGSDVVSELSDVCATQMSDLERIAEEAGMKETVTTKSTKTQEKIQAMAEQYVGDEWDDVAEVLEWMSFFVGGATAHWDVITGGGNAMQHTTLESVAKDGASYYQGLFEKVRAAGHAVGTARAAV